MELEVTAPIIIGSKISKAEAAAVGREIVAKIAPRYKGTLVRFDRVEPSKSLGVQWDVWYYIGSTPILHQIR